MAETSSLASRIDAEFSAVEERDWHGQKFYFVSEETRSEFAEKNKMASK